MEGAGVDPETGPATWDEFRQAAKAMTDAGNGRIYGWIQGLNFPERLGVHVDELAQTAGSPGAIDFTTGAYTYDTEPYAQAIEFLLSLQEDGSLFPASSTLDARTGRARWATGVAGMFFDGPWNIGVVQTDFADFADKVGVATIPTPEGADVKLHHAPTGGVFWISSQSEHADIASDILAQFTTPEYYVGLAERMDQPPLDLSAVEQADVHPSYARAIQLFTERVRLAPSPTARNPAISQVQAEMKDIHPNLGEIAQGVFSGDVADYKAALKDYNDQLTAERDRAIKVVTDGGGEVSVDDWAFANWQPGEDFTPEMYEQGS
jgi:multiple sugar transport system substrate-binding protein